MVPIKGVERSVSDEIGPPPHGTLGNSVCDKKNIIYIFFPHRGNGWKMATDVVENVATPGTYPGPGQTRLGALVNFQRKSTK